MSDPRTGAGRGGIEVIWCLPDGTRRNQTVADMDSLMMLLRSPAGVTIEHETYQIAHSELKLKDRRFTAIVQLRK